MHLNLQKPGACNGFCVTARFYILNMLAESFLKFDSKKPLTFIDTIAGRELIKNTVNRLKYGYNA